jgi:uncharacterized repeat protein (TIGR01451 family)
MAVYSLRFHAGMVACLGQVMCAALAGRLARRLGVSWLAWLKVLVLLTAWWLPASAQAQAFLNVNKAFSPATLSVGQTASFVVTFANTDSVNAITSVQGTDTLPAGLALVRVDGSTCGLQATGTVFVSGANVLFSNGTVPAGAGSAGPACSVAMVVTPLTAGSLVNTIPAANVTGLRLGAPTTANAPAQATITANGSLAALTGVKTALQTHIHGGGTQSFRIVLSNGNALPATGLAFTDTLPTTLRVAGAVPVSENTCGGTVTNLLGGALSDGDPGFRLSGGLIGANSTCAVTFAVRPSDFTTPTNAVQTNTIPAGGVTTTIGISNAAAISGSISLQRGATVGQVYVPASIVAGGTTLLSITLGNFNLGTITNAVLADTLEGNVSIVSVAPGTSCPGSITTSGASFTATNVILAPAPNPNGNSTSICLIQLVVTSGTPGVYANPIAAGALAGVGFGATTATLTVTTPPGVIGGSKSFSPASIFQGATATLTVNLTNASAATATNVAFTDNLLATMGANITIASPNGLVNTCAGAVVATPGSPTFSLSGGSIPPAGTCTVSLLVQTTSGTPIGLRTNTIPAGSVTTSLGSNTAPISASLTVLSDIGVTKLFAPASVPQTGTSVLTINLTNAGGPGGPAAITSFIDDLTTMGGSITLVASPAPFTTCGGTLTAVAGSTTISLAGGSVPNGGSCQITAAVRAAANALPTSRTNTVAANGLQTNIGANQAAATAALAVTPAATVSKTFSPTTVAVNGVSRLSVNIAHAAGAAPFTGMGLVDNLPAGHVVASPANATNNCGGSLSATSGAASVTLAGASMPLGASTCTFAFDVLVSGVAGSSTNVIPAGALVTAEGVTNGSTATAVIQRVAAGTGPGVLLNKSFVPPNISSGSSSQLRVFIDNTANAFPLTSASLTDAFPAGMVVAGTPGGSTTCGSGVVSAGVGSTSVSLSGATVPASSSCSFAVNVTSAAGGNSVNTIPAGALSSAQSVSNVNSPSATLQVLFNLNLDKGFSPSVVQAGGTSLLTISVFNSNTSTFAGTTTGALLDSLPSGLVVAAPGVVGNTCGGALSDAGGSAIVPGSTAVRLNGGTFNASSACAIQVAVTTAAAGATGSFVNVIPAGNLTVVGGLSNPTPAQATVTFVASPQVTKAFLLAGIAPGEASSLTFTLTNPNSASLWPSGLTQVQFSDALPAGMSVRQPGVASGTCAGAGSNALAQGQTSLSLTVTSLPAGSSCTLVVSVTATSVGAYVNTAGAALSAQTPRPSASVTTATLTVLAAPSFSKTFSPSNVLSGGTATVTLTIRLENLNAANTVTLASPAFVDLLPISPSQMTIASPLPSTACLGASLQNQTGGALAVGSTGLRLMGGQLPPASACTVTAVVRANLYGTYLNSIPNVTSTNAGVATGPATATLTVTPAVNLSVSKTNFVSTLSAGSSTTYQITVINAGPGDASGALLRDVPSAGLQCVSMSCLASGPATCPSSSISALLGTGLAIPTLAAGGQVVVSVTCNVTAIP